jgi:nicotinate-nucleotide adenylyltransferase
VQPLAQAPISPRFDGAIEAIEISEKAFRLGIFGGTFDPVHVGHLHIAARAREQFSLDGVLFIPTGQPVRKLDGTLTAGEERYAMLRAAIDDNPYFDASRIEIEREGTTYTIDTLRAIKERYGERAECFFIGGFDATADIDSWKDSDQIAKMVTILSARRTITPDLELSLLHNESCFDILPIDSCLIDVSSSELRTLVRQGQSIRYLVPDQCYAYIREQGLYQG